MKKTGAARWMRNIAFPCVSLAASAAHADDAADIRQFIDSRYEETAAIARQLWEHAEVGYQEVESSGLLQEVLGQEGFSVEAGVAGIPTAFVASHGEGAPVIGILAEFDALPGINQDAVPLRSPIEGKTAGHSTALENPERFEGTWNGFSKR